MVKGNIACWTPEKENPPYVSINHVYRFTPMVEIVVRGIGKNGELGKTVSVEMSSQEFDCLVAQINKNKGC
jgi:D-arabinose 5-phosphate isomerase GutQ